MNAFSPEKWERIGFRSIEEGFSMLKEGGLRNQKWFHAKGMLFPGVVFALIPALLVSWLVTLIA